jgi:hypothetical protein
MSVNLTSILQNIQTKFASWVGLMGSRQVGVILEDTATVTWGYDGYGNITATAAGGTLPTATGAGQVLTATGPGTTYTAQALPVGSASQGGIVEVDGTTITATAGVISAAGLQLISSKTMTGVETSVSFPSIPQTYKNLKLVIQFNATSGANMTISFNGDSTSGHYAWGLSYQNSNTPNAAGSGSSEVHGLVGGALGTIVIDIPNYKAAVPNVYYTALWAAFVLGGSNLSGSACGAWSGTDVTSIILADSGAAVLASGSVFSLYGY